MKSITFQLVRGAGVTSRLIGWFGGGYYSHIDVLTPKGELRGARSDWLMNIPPGVRDRPSPYEKWARQTRFTISVTDTQYEAFWAFSDAQVGKPYDERGLVNTFLFGRDWRDDGQWWCSELVAANLEVAGIIKLPAEIKSVEPGDCADIFAGLQASVQEV